MAVAGPVCAYALPACGANAMANANAAAGRAARAERAVWRAWLGVGTGNVVRSSGVDQGGVSRASTGCALTVAWILTSAAASAFSLSGQRRVLPASA